MNHQPNCELMYMGHVGDCRLSFGEDDQLPLAPSNRDTVKVLSAIDGSDPEDAHRRADQALLAFVPAEVADAYRAVIGRCGWWAAS